ncbi:MAG: PHP domain-containing protein [Desulfobulbaceae bacterium]|nr:PHP domain-containing protein [Desulfobulbaceae bacterium]
MIDLHIHSTLSDGTMSPFEIVSAARVKGVSALSITDHDTMAAYPEAFRIGEAQQVEVVPGVEITAHHQEISLHILGFGLDCHSVSLAEGLCGIQQARQRRNQKIIEKLNNFKLAVSMDDFPCDGRGQTGRPHIAQLLVRKGVVRTEQEAFAKFLRKDGAAYVQRQLLPVRQAISMIIGAGGVAVLAHPGSLKMPEGDLKRMIHELQTVGLSGVEAYHPMNSEKMLRFLLRICHVNGLLVTGGSDFHGRSGDKAPLGEAGCRRQVPGHLLTALKDRFADFS